MIVPMTRLDWTIDPFCGLNRLHRDMSRFFSGPSSAIAQFPALNVWTSENGVVLSAEIPGVDPKDVDVSVEGNVVTVAGERKADSTLPADRVHRGERETGTFSRSVRLPYEVEANRVEARYEWGTLRITLPRKEASKPRKISITAE